MSAAKRPGEGSDGLMPAERVLRNLAVASTAVLVSLLIVGFLFLRPRSA